MPLYAFVSFPVKKKPGLFSPGFERISIHNTLVYRFRRSSSRTPSIRLSESPKSI